MPRLTYPLYINDCIDSVALLSILHTGRQILTTEIITPWVFVGVLAALELVTTALLVVVICKYRSRETPEKSVRV